MAEIIKGCRPFDQKSSGRRQRCDLNSSITSQITAAEKCPPSLFPSLTCALEYLQSRTAAGAAVTVPEKGPLLQKT